MLSVDTRINQYLSIFHVADVGWSASTRRCGTWSQSRQKVDGYASREAKWRIVRKNVKVHEAKSRLVGQNVPYMKNE